MDLFILYFLPLARYAIDGAIPETLAEHHFLPIRFYAIRGAYAPNVDPRKGN